MFEKPSDPRSGSLEERQRVWSLLVSGERLGVELRRIERSDVQHLPWEELRDAAYELERLESGIGWALALVRREEAIRLEQSHVVGKRRS